MDNTSTSVIFLILQNSDYNIDIYFDRCKILNSNPVLFARHFQYNFGVVFKEMFLVGHLEK